MRKCLAWKAAYEKSLELLKARPNDSELRGETLYIGREFASFQRERGQTVFDEVAIKNDIDSACAGIITQSTVSSQPNNSLKERLAKVQRLFDDSLISKKEYETKRKQILDSI